MNALVILSSVAASVFFFYVLVSLRVFGGSGTPEVDIATSAVPAVVPVLQGTGEGGLRVELRDLDEADAYRDALTDKTRASLGIEAPGRLYRLRVANTGKDRVEISAPAMTLRAAGADWSVAWLPAVADRKAANSTGRLMLDQAAAEFGLGPGESRQIVVFIGGDAPPVGQVTGGEFRALGLGMELKREDTRVVAQ